MQFSHSKLLINLKNLKNNYQVIKNLCKESVCSAVVKANAYGLGDTEISKFLIKNGCNDFWVANISEALRIKQSISKINIYVFNGLNKGEEELFYNNNLIPVINTFDQFQRWTSFLNNKNSYDKLIVQFDTGMCRSGIQLNEVEKLKKNIKVFNKFKDIILMTHLACADDKNNEYNLLQKKRFLKISKDFPGCRYSLAASGGIFLGKDYHLDMVRPGIALYGGRLFFNRKLKNVVSLNSPVIQLNQLKKNETAGYSRTFKTNKNILTATIPLGYADGIKIGISNKGFVYYGNTKLPMIGRISMDLMIINATKVKDKIKVGDHLEIFGENFKLDDFAKLSNTLPYDIITSVSERCRRLYQN